MPRKRTERLNEFVEPDLVGDRLIERTILDEVLPESEAIEEIRDHPERPLPGKRTGRQGKASEPPRNDPRHNDQSVPPGHRDVPAGTERPARTGSN